MRSSRQIISTTATLRANRFHGHRKASSRRIFSRPLRLEHLEERTVLSTGIITTAIESGSTRGFASFLDSSNNIVVAGDASGKFAILRYQPNGTLDSTFGSGGVVTTAFRYTSYALAAAPDPATNRIVAGGIAGTKVSSECRLWTGALQHRRQPRHEVQQPKRYRADRPRRKRPAVRHPRSSSRQQDRRGRLERTRVVAFHFTLARYLATGALDTGFGSGGVTRTSFGGRYDEATAVVPHQGRILAVGFVSNTDGTSDFALARYNANGSLDTTFDFDGKTTTRIAGKTTSQISAAAIDANGNTIVAGHAWANESWGDDLAIARYLPNGALDTTFGTNGIVLTDLADGEIQAKAVAIQGDGKIVVAGYKQSGETGETFEFVVARYNVNGSPDDGTTNDMTPSDSFGNGGLVVTPILAIAQARSVLVQPDGKIVVTGYAKDAASRSYVALARYTADGQLDTTFGEAAAGTMIASSSLADNALEDSFGVALRSSKSPNVSQPATTSDELSRTAMQPRVETTAVARSYLARSTSPHRQQVHDELFAVWDAQWTDLIDLGLANGR